MSFTLSDLYRRFENLIRIGTIAEVDEQNLRLRVQSGELLTDWLPWPGQIGNNFIQWRPLRVNTQVVLCCPSGDPAQALIVSILYTEALKPTNVDASFDVIQFNDGTTLQYDAAQKALTLSSASDIHLIAQNTIHLQAGNTVQSTAENHVTKGKVRIEGAVTQTGGDFTSDGISVQQHQHIGVASGTAKTGAPE